MDKQEHTEEYKRGFHCGYETARQKFENKPKKIEPDMSRLTDLCAIPPQGEWVGGDQITYSGNLMVSGCWHCSNCGALAGVENNFCGRCGAKMKGGAEE